MNYIMTGVDEKKYYWNHLLAFLASVDKNSPETRVIVNLVNRGLDDYAKTLTCFKCVSMVNRTNCCGTDFQKNYLRHEWLAEIMIGGCRGDNIAWLDPDILVRGSLSPLFDGMGRNCIKFWRRPSVKNEYEFQGGVYILNNSQRCYDFCKSIYDRLQGTNDWLLPQLLCLKNIKTLKLQEIPLPESFNDSKFNPESTIWHCKHSHFNDKKFQKEFKKYHELGKRKIGEQS